MAISQFDKDVEVIQKLDDEPNDVQGLTPAELKKRFDQAAIWLKEYINSTLIPAITGDGASGGGASNIGASVDDFPGNTVQDVLDAFNDALIARYTKAETNAYVGQETNDLVSSVSVNLNTGVITVTKKDGTKDTFDTALEKVPATMALVDDGGKTYLVITNQDGSQTRTDVSKLIDTYTFVNSSEVSFSLGGSGNNRTVTASIRPNSIGPDRFTLEVTQALEQYNAESAASAEAAAASEQAAKTSEINAKKSETASKESADTAIQKSSEAERSAENANLSAGSAAESANVAHRNAGEALGAKNAAIQAQKSIENMQVSANTLPAGTDATVTKTVEDGTVKLNFGLPQGADGSAIAADGLWGVRVDENGDLILTYVGDEVPPLSIKDGDLIYTLDGNEINLGHVVGAPGADGATGPEGPPGQAATIEIAETETVAPDTPAAMVELPDSTPQARRYKAQVPQGEQGPAGLGVPPISGPEDAGKVPTVNGDGTGYVLEAGGSGGDWALVGSVTTEEEVAQITVTLNKPCKEIVLVVDASQLYSDGSAIGTRENFGNIRINNQSLCGAVPAGGSAKVKSQTHIIAAGGTTFMSHCLAWDKALEQSIYGPTQQVPVNEIDSVSITPKYKFVANVGYVGRFAIGSSVEVYGR